MRESGCAVCDNLTMNDPYIKLNGSQVTVCVQADRQTDTNGATLIMALPDVKILIYTLFGHIHIVSIATIP
jgi:hypothetical protein